MLSGHLHHQLSTSSTLLSLTDHLLHITCTLRRSIVIKLLPRALQLTTVLTSGLRKLTLCCPLLPYGYICKTTERQSAQMSKDTNGDNPVWHRMLYGNSGRQRVNHLLLLKSQLTSVWPASDYNW